ncbi:Hexameric tyrosine-coordinated heme protein (HTHP) [Actinoalloteichus cyanogriseus DSM 43889]|uniref:Hexameric tyrosine-coordinated heme protein (HTHP) n=2 Tax=Pseudonocardiaceae TaxID=2070 RepID=A0ABT1JJZ6_ACTCY|nr:Hexameric tyrosine-coordinated heme protein (HTHP) [Actinoalloteichus caeruleus DSM 43889]
MGAGCHDDRLMTHVVPKQGRTTIPGNTLIVPTPEHGRELALQLARHSVQHIQPDHEILRGGRPHYATDPDSLIEAAQVVATEFATIAAANDYWR